MANLDQAVASKDAFAVLQQTIESNVMEQLPRIVHAAIRKGVVAAAKSAPAEEVGKEPAASAQSRPASDGICAKVWDTLDKAAKDKGEAPTLQEVQKLAKRKRWNANTARVQYYRWRSAQPQTNTSVS